MDTSNLGRALIFLGILLILIGGGFWLSDRVPFLHSLGRLPGDFRFGGKNWKVYFPLGSSLLISVILSFILWVISKWMR